MKSDWIIFAGLLACLAYFRGLDGRHIPKNTDDYSYEQVTRLTAESGRLLPLRASDPQLRDTKPPLLFWQGMAATDGGRNWTLERLRLPSVGYTLLVALLLALLGRRLAGEGEPGWIAALSYLGFYDTFRYGRPFLTDPPEVFWAFLPVFLLLFHSAGPGDSPRFRPILSGICLGAALLYKSFAVAAPVAAAFAWWGWWRRYFNFREFLRLDSGGILLMCVIALGIFGLWFDFDPDPGRIWRDFIVRENIAKLGWGGGPGYFSGLLLGRGSVWDLGLSFLAGTGLLVFPVIAAGAAAWRRRFEITEEEIFLWIWIFAWFAVFALPAERSARHLLPALPAVALILALHWNEIGRGWFIATLALAGVALVLLADAALGLERALGRDLYTPADRALFVLAAAVVLAGLFLPGWTRRAACPAVLLCFLSLSEGLRPWDGPLGAYDPAAIHQVAGREVGVPCGARAEDEAYRFLLPGADVVGYDLAGHPSPTELYLRHSFYILRLPWGRRAIVPGKIVASRIDLRTGQSGEELWTALLSRNWAPALLERELLVQGR